MQRGESGASDLHIEVGKAGSLRCTVRQPPAAPSAIGTQPDFSALKNQRSPSRDEQPGAASPSQAGPVRQEKSITIHLPSQSWESR